MSDVAIKFEVGAYLPEGELKPILIPLLADKFIGYAARQGEQAYADLKQVCGGNPKWLFGQSPLPL